MEIRPKSVEKIRVFLVNAGHYSDLVFTKFYISVILTGSVPSDVQILNSNLKSQNSNNNNKLDLGLYVSTFDWSINGK